MNAHKRILIVSNILVCLLSASTLLFAAGESARGDSMMPEGGATSGRGTTALEQTAEGPVISSIRIAALELSSGM